MTSKIVIDPVTRIEGHLRMETEVTSNVVSNAWSTGTLFRGVEVILKNRDPRDAWMLTQRICGVCTYVHGLTSIRSVENSIGLTVPDNARLIRNLLMGAQYVHDHIIHFYALHLLDWVDITKALDANPDDAVTADRQICSSRTRDEAYFTAVKAKLAGFVGSGQLGPFANGYWGHEGYKLSPAMSLVMMANYLEALRFQAKIIKMHAILGGKNPHPQSLIIGGMTPWLDFNPDRIIEFQDLCAEAKAFVDTFYLPDATAIATHYREYASIGSCDNLLCFGEFPQSSDEPASLFFPRGAIFGKATFDVRSVDVADITEHVARSWYEGSSPHNPAEGDTVPVYTGIDLEEKYSWLKAPRYNGQPMEVGPLARVMVAYGQGMPAIVSAVNDFCSATFLTLNNLPDLPKLYSTIGRTGARAIETKVIADAMIDWSAQLYVQRNDSNQATFTMQPAGTGFALNEAPRGALGHWLNYSNTKIDNYQMVVPSTWNFGPRDDANVPGPVEQALIGTPVVNDLQPLEVLRVIHSFDPCIACAVHLVNLTGDDDVDIKVL